MLDSNLKLMKINLSICRHHTGSRASFCIYGLLSGCVLAGFLYVRRKVTLLEGELEVKVDDSEALGGYGAPQGVPSAIPGKIGQPASAVTAQDIDYQW